MPATSGPAAANALSQNSVMLSLLEKMAPFEDALALKVYVSKGVGQQAPFLPFIGAMQLNISIKRTSHFYGLHHPCTLLDNKHSIGRDDKVAIID